MIDKSPVTYPASKPPEPAPATENASPPPPPGAAGVQRDRLTLQQEEVTLRTLFDTLPDILYVKDLDLTYRLVNPACCHLMGLGEEAVIGRGDRDPRFPPDLVATMMRHDPEVLAQGEPRLNESLVTGADGTPRWFRTRVTPLRDASDRIAGLFGVGQDITALMAEQGRGQRLSRLRQHLLDLVDRDDHELILRTALDVAEELTHSQIGFLHFISEDEREVSLQVWSTRTRAEMCFAEGNGLHYPISQAGVWVDCILQRQPVIHNDYASLPHQKGMPEGHTPLVREATVPLLVDGRVVAVIGVGNKAHDYSQQDLEILGQILEIAIHCADRQRFERQQEYLAFYDVLTGLPNRALLIEQLNQAIAQANRSNQLIAVCYLNLDAFKLINETYGQPIGDALLVSLAQRLQGSLRPGDSLARAGGDEFALILAGLASAFDGQEAIQRVLKQITQPIDVQGHRIFVAGSMGVTLFPLDPDGPDALLHHAQKAMYQAKGMNRSGYHFYDPVQDQQMRQLRRLREEFTLALQDGQLLLYYQPKIDLRDASLIGLEALIRWRHPREGLLEPAQFLPQIKDSPLEIALGEWVVTQALAQQQAWRQVGVALAVSINVSPRQIQMRGFADLVTRTLAAYPPGTAEQLEIEILDIAEIGNTGDAAQVMNACKALGVRFALDDFGTGYSSLTYLKRLPADMIKIDQSFVRDMLDDPEDLAIIDGVIGLATAFGREVIAEGVESAAHGELLLLMGCTLAQGYYIALPMPAEDLPGWSRIWRPAASWLAPTTGASGRELFPVLLAITHHRAWIGALEACLTGSASTPPPPDEHHCHFGAWLEGEGRTRWGTHRGFQESLATHHRLHCLAEELLTWHARGETAAARNRLGELRALSDDLTGALRALIRGGNPPAESPPSGDE